MKSISTKQREPRGIRNNNPLNIRIGNAWLGEVPNPTDSDFEQFVSPVYGLRAGFCILRRYIRRYHRNTIETIIHAWAPSSENNTANYVQIVCQRTGLVSDQPILYEDSETMCKLVQAMCFVECGREIPADTIIKGYKIA